MNECFSRDLKRQYITLNIKWRWCFTEFDWMSKSRSCYCKSKCRPSKNQAVVLDTWKSASKDLIQMETENLIHYSKKKDLICAHKHMPFCIFLFLFHSSNEPNEENKRRCIPLGSRPSNRVKQEVCRVIEFHTNGNHYFLIYNLVYINFSGVNFLLFL